MLPAGKETAFQSGLNNLGILVILIHIYIVVFFVIVFRKCHLKCFLFLTKEFQRFQNASPRTGPSLVHYSTQVGRCSCIMKPTPTTETELPPERDLHQRARGISREWGIQY